MNIMNHVSKRRIDKTVFPDVVEKTNSVIVVILIIQLNRINIEYVNIFHIIVHNKHLVTVCSQPDKEAECKTSEFIHILSPIDRIWIYQFNEKRISDVGKDHIFFRSFK